MKNTTTTTQSQREEHVLVVALIARGLPRALPLAPATLNDPIAKALMASAIALRASREPFDLGAVVNHLAETKQLERLGGRKVVEEITKRRLAVKLSAPLAAFLRDTILHRADRRRLAKLLSAWFEQIEASGDDATLVEKEALAQLEAFRLPVGEGRVMYLINEGEAVCGQIADILKLSPSTVSRIASKLAVKGLVRVTGVGNQRRYEPAD